MAIPILLKRLGASEPVSLFVCYAVAYLFAVTEIQGDNFVLLIGVLLLALISQRLPVLTYQRIFAIQLFILPQFLVVQLLNGIPPATGMFYWTYYLFHSSPALYSLLGGVILWYGLLILYLVALVMTLGYLLPRAGTAGPPGTRTPAPRHSRLNSSPWRLHRLGPTSTILLGAVVVLAVILPVTITLDPDIGKPSGSISGFDSGLFLPLEYGSGCFVFPECASILASTGTYQVNGSNAEAYFASSSEAVGLYPKHDRPIVRPPIHGKCDLGDRSLDRIHGCHQYDQFLRRTRSCRGRQQQFDCGPDAECRSHIGPTWFTDARSLRREPIFRAWGECGADLQPEPAGHRGPAAFLRI